MTWKIGDPSNPTDEDLEVDTEAEAIQEAESLAQEDYDRPIAVWDMNDCSIAHLFLCGQQFRSA